MRITVTVEAPGRSTDVLVDCDDATPAATVREALAALAGVPGAPVTLAPAPHPHRTGAAGDLAAWGVVDGMRLGVGVDVSGAAPVPGGLQLHVVSGPDSGAVFALPQGVHELGRSGRLSWRDHSLSRRHCRVVASPESVTVADLGSSNGSVLDGVACGPEPRVWEPGQQLEIGDSVVELRAARAPDATVEPAEPGWLHFLRPPRIEPHRASPVVELPTAPVATPRGRRLLGGGRRDAELRAAQADYDERLAAALDRLADARREEARQRRDALPDAAATYLTCLLPGRRLWERRRGDADALVLRVGTGPAASEVTVVGGEEDGGELRSVPIGLDLARAGVVGVAGNAEQVDAVLRWLVVQLAAHHAPRDVSLTFLTAGGGREWSWLRWLPHARPAPSDAGEGPTALVGNDAEPVAAQVAALTGLMKDRREQLAADAALRPGSFSPHVLVVHGYRALRGVPGLGQLLEDGPALGIHAVCTDDGDRSLPERCTATLVVDPGNPSYGALLRSGERPVPRLRLEGVSASWCDALARALSPLRDLGAEDRGDRLPDQARLLDVTGLEPPTADAVRARWALDPASTTMTVGVGLDGPVRLDLAGDGPHGLVAGMTGSGKTELLQTLIASLALGNRPDRLSLVLVDYKGDAAFKDCEALPHTVGKVTDLDPHQVERALTSLQAELKHRERVLAGAGAKDLDDYQRLPGVPPLPRLVLVIDEFAQLVKDLPDFVAGLVRIAQLGRSLGIHLLLATQRPSGVVSPEIRANTNLRIALRVADAADSVDVLDTPDAARIPRSSPGRALARLGAGALVPFQTARIGGRRPGVAPAELAPPFVVPVDWRAVGYPPPRPARPRQVEETDTDLALVVETVREAARLEGVPPQRRPWLAPLPARLDWAPLASGAAVRGVVPPLPWGIADLPDRQAQEIAALDLAADGHLLVVGSPGSGRSQLLRTLAASIGRLTDPADVHLYALDCGNGALSSLSALPHCGAVVGRSETDRAGRLLHRIGAEIEARQRTGATDPLPRVVLLVDRWEGFVSTLGQDDALGDVLTRIVREGASVGVHLVMTGDRTLATTTRLAALTDNKVALRLADRADYALLGLVPRRMPDVVPPGRAFGPGGVEVQVALTDESALAPGAGSASESDGPRPFRIDPLPDRVTLAEALELVPRALARPVAVVGVGGDELTSYAADLRRSSAFVVAGPGRSGRSSVLLGAALSWLETGGQVLVVAPRPSTVRDLAGRDGVLAVATDPTNGSEAYDAAVAGVAVPVLVVVDDGEVVQDTAANDFFRRVVTGHVPGVSMLLGGHHEGIGKGLRGWQVEARKTRQGLLLSPQGPADGDLVGVRLPRSVVGPIRPGRGWLHAGDGVLVQVSTVLPRSLVE